MVTRGPSQVRVAGPLAPHADGFRAALDARGFSPWSQMFYLHLLADVSRWLGRHGLDATIAGYAHEGGRALIVDMLPHDRESYRQQMGHVWLGFSDEHVRRLFQEAGFEDVRIVSLPPDARAKGPGLFVATARRPLG